MAVSESVQHVCRACAGSKTGPYFRSEAPVLSCHLCRCGCGWSGTSGQRVCHVWPYGSRSRWRHCERGPPQIGTPSSCPRRRFLHGVVSCHAQKPRSQYTMIAILTRRWKNTKLLASSLCTYKKSELIIGRDQHKQ